MTFQLKSRATITNDFTCHFNIPYFSKGCPTYVLVSSEMRGFSAYIAHPSVKNTFLDLVSNHHTISPHWCSKYSLRPVRQGNMSKGQEKERGIARKGAKQGKEQKKARGKARQEAKQDMAKSKKRQRKARHGMEWQAKEQDKGKDNGQGKGQS